MTTPTTLASRALPVRWLMAAAGPAVVALLVGGLALVGARRTRDAAGRVDHAHRVVESANLMLARLVDAETGQRGYLLTGRNRYLEPYVGAERDITATQDSLRRLVADYPRQRARLDTLDVLVREKLAELGATTTLRRSGDRAAALARVETGQGKAVMDSARVVLSALVAHEEERLVQLQANERRYGRNALLVVIGGVLIAGLLAFVVALALLRTVARERVTALGLSDANEQLLHQAEELTRSNGQLHEQGLELELQNQHLQDQAGELEAQADDLQVTATQLAERSQQAELARADANQAREAAEEASRAKGDFLATMSHELRTPLNAIAGYVQLLEMGLHGPVTVEQRATLARMGRVQRHLLGLINDVLKVAKLEGGHVEYDVREVALADAVADVLPLVEPQLSAKEISCRVDLYVSTNAAAKEGPHDRGLIAWADPDKLRQILLNLLSNAAKFTAVNGSVTIDARLSPDRREHVLLRVVDTGRGIPADQLERIFEPFVQVRAQYSGTSEGTGLGLAISRDLARGMGGDLTVDSTVGMGSTFTLALRRVART